MATQAECLDAAERAAGRALARRERLTPEDAARAAYRPGGMSVEAIADLIRRQRAETVRAAA